MLARSVAVAVDRNDTMFIFDLPTASDDFAFRPSDFGIRAICGNKCLVKNTSVFTLLDEGALRRCRQERPTETCREETCTQSMTLSPAVFLDINCN